MITALAKERVREIAFARPMVGEEERRAVAEVLAGPTLVHGPKAEEFEDAFAEFTGARYAVSVSSCTAAMHLAYLGVGLQAGDEVIVPAQTHVATAHAVELAGGVPVFVDAEGETGNMDLDLVEEAITERTRAIAVVHYMGRPVDMDRLLEIAQRHDLFVLEDCALALGSYYRGEHAGLRGDAGCFSFYPVKHITTAEGGMIITKDQELAERVRLQRAFGVDKTPAERDAPGEYDVLALGLNYRMNEIEAVLGIEQLKKLPDFLKRRAANMKVLREELTNIKEVRCLAGSDGEFVSSEYGLGVLLDDSLVAKKADIVIQLKECGVGTSVYYPKPVPHLTYYREKYAFGEDSYPMAENISRRSITLPVGPHLNEEDMKYIAKTLKDAISYR